MGGYLPGCDIPESQMKSLSMDAVSEFRKVIELESQALQQLLGRADTDIEDAIEVLWNCEGKIVVCGMGKCGHVGRKIAATFVSTGTPAAFLHPAEAIHGDIGYVSTSDVALVLSYSGETDEIAAVLPPLKRLGIKIVAITGRPGSILGTSSDAVIDVSVNREADPIDMVPTSSTTTMMAVGDALAVVFMLKRNFGKEDYAALHPGGSLGQKLLCQVSDLIHTGEDIPVAPETVSVREAIVEMTSKRLGATFLTNGAGELTGILTDGDLRRLLQEHSQPLDLEAREIMTHGPKHVRGDVLAVDALRIMEDNLITILPVIDAGNRPVGALHIHDLIRAGIA